MPVNFVEELRWRGMLQDIMPGTEELLTKEVVTGYIGFDPTADSLHIGSLIPIMMLKHMLNRLHCLEVQQEWLVILQENQTKETC